MISLALAMLFVQATPGPSRPDPIDSVRLFFLAGDLSKAQQLARACAKKRRVSCKTMVQRLAWYAELARRLDALTPSEARTFIELDRAISPSAPGKLTQQVLERFVSTPLELARRHAASGHPESARLIAQRVLEVDPSNAEAKRLAAPP